MSSRQLHHQQYMTENIARGEDMLKTMHNVVHVVGDNNSNNSPNTKNGIPTTMMGMSNKPQPTGMPPMLKAMGTSSKRSSGSANRVTVMDPDDEVVLQLANELRRERRSSGGSPVVATSINLDVNSLQISNNQDGLHEQNNNTAMQQVNNGHRQQLHNTLPKPCMPKVPSQDNNNGGASFLQSTGSSSKHTSNLPPVNSAQQRSQPASPATGTHSKRSVGRAMIITEKNEETGEMEQFEVIWENGALQRKKYTPPEREGPKMTRDQLDDLLAGLVDMGDGCVIEESKPAPAPPQAQATNHSKRTITSYSTNASQRTAATWRDQPVLDPFTEDEKNLLDVECESMIMTGPKTQPGAPVTLPLSVALAGAEKSPIRSSSGRREKLQQATTGDQHMSGWLVEQQISSGNFEQ